MLCGFYQQVALTYYRCIGNANSDNHIILTDMLLRLKGRSAGWITMPLFRMRSFAEVALPAVQAVDRTAWAAGWHLAQHGRFRQIDILDSMGNKVILDNMDTIGTCVTTWTTHHGMSNMDRHRGQHAQYRHTHLGMNNMDILNPVDNIGTRITVWATWTYWTAWTTCKSWTAWTTWTYWTTWATSHEQRGGNWTAWTSPHGQREPTCMYMFTTIASNPCSPRCPMQFLQMHLPRTCKEGKLKIAPDV